MTSTPTHGKPCRCGSGKRTRDALCRDCFTRLSAAQQRALYDKRTREAAYRAACETLDKETPSGGK